MVTSQLVSSYTLLSQPLTAHILPALFDSHPLRRLFGSRAVSVAEYTADYVVGYAVKYIEEYTEEYAEEYTVEYTEE